MNIPSPKISPRRASAALIVLVFLTLMAAIVVSNNLTLRHLDRNLRLIEQKQLKRSGVHQARAY
ncbi:MAG TPA: hypothetical protein VH619_00640 [Verrucomicrobiae bacterium]|jgi:hypothetical protein|nr:hypothetical protein [Verrucomicrobiae bacterium]